MPERWRVCSDPNCSELISSSSPCPRGHGRQPVRNWGGRNTNEQKTFARAVKRRDRHRCVRCGSTEDLRAAHLVPVHKGGTYNPSNGTTLCRNCDRASDPYAR